MQISFTVWLKGACFWFPTLSCFPNCLARKFSLADQQISWKQCVNIALLSVKLWLLLLNLHCKVVFGGNSTWKPGAITVYTLSLIHLYLDVNLGLFALICK